MTWWQIILGVVLLLPLAWFCLAWVAIELVSGGFEWFFEYALPVGLALCTIAGIWLIVLGVM